MYSKNQILVNTIKNIKLTHIEVEFTTIGGNSITFLVSSILRMLPKKSVSNTLSGLTGNKSFLEVTVEMHTRFGQT